MAKPLKSQWEFGELFPAEEVRKVLTVSEMTGSIRRLLEKEIGTAAVMGEITNLRIQSSGHVYFTIKDSNAQLSCVLFRNEARAVNREFLQDGQKVIVEGEITVYEARGQYQLRVFSLQLQGVGALQAAFERLKLKLQAEGLFDQGHKRPLPAYPKVIGLVTSPVGAAIHDLLHGIQRRDPGLRVILAPCRVQGAGAGPEIAAAIHLLNEWALPGMAGRNPVPEAIIVSRGGGSLEDLWAFNEEIVARAIYASALPVISAVGHEVDFTISDFVADFRAATPTAASEIVTEGVFSCRPFVLDARARLSGLLTYSLNQKADRLLVHQRRLARLHPRRRFAELAQRLDDYQSSIARCLKHQLRQKQNSAQAARARLARVRPDALIRRRRDRLNQVLTRLNSRAGQEIRRLNEKVLRLSARLRLLSPQNVLDRGYSITTDARGKVLRNFEQASAGDEIITRLRRGRLASRVIEAKSD